MSADGWVRKLECWLRLEELGPTREEVLQRVGISLSRRDAGKGEGDVALFFRKGNRAEALVALLLSKTKGDLTAFTVAALASEHGFATWTLIGFPSSLLVE